MCVFELLFAGCPVACDTLDLVSELVLVEWLLPQKSMLCMMFGLAAPLMIGLDLPVST